MASINIVILSVPGGELFNYVVDRKLLDERQARFIFWQLLTAIKVSLYRPRQMHCLLILSLVFTQQQHCS